MKYRTAALLLAAGPLAQAQSQHVLLVGMDGVRGDAFDAMLNQNASNLDNIRSLFENGNGLYTPRASTSDITGSWGGWSDVLRGVHRDEHQAGYWGSGGVGNFDPGPDHPDLVGAPGLFDRVETYNGSLDTASFITWDRLHVSMDSSSSSAGIDRGADTRFFTNYNSNGDNVVASQAASYLSATTGGVSTNTPEVVLFYQADTDIAGHNNGFGPNSLSNNVNSFSSGYRNEINETDDNIGQVLTALRNRPGVVDGSEEWLIILTSDHGGTFGGHSQNRVGEREVPFIVSGLNTNVVSQTPGSNPVFVQPKNIDVVPTILDHLNVPTSDAAWDGLRGNVVGDTASVQPTIAVGTNLVFNGDADYDRGFNGHNELIKNGGAWDDQRDSPVEGLWWDQDVSGWDDWSQTPSRNSMTVMYYGSGGGYPANSDPGPTDRGTNLFSAGIDGNSTMTQRLDVSSIADIIDDDGVAFDISAWLGGYVSDSDNATFQARFLAANGSTQLGSATLTGPTAGPTGLTFLSDEGDLVSGTRFIEFVLSTSGNDGYADNLGFKIRYHGDLNGDGFVGIEDMDILLANWGRTDITAGSLQDGDANADGVINAADLQIVRDHWGNGTPAGNVPEPGTLALIALGGVAITRRRRR